MFDVDPNVLYTLMVGWVFSATVHALPEIKPDSPAWYVFVYRLAHSLFANIGMLTKKPNSPPTTTN
jgi:hypothetical protein